MDCPAAARVSDLDLQTKHVAQLPFKREEVGIDRALALRLATATGACRLRRAGAVLGLPDGQPTGDNFMRDPDWIRGADQSSGMAHADLAAHEHGSNFVG